MTSSKEESANYRSTYETGEQTSDARSANYRREKPEHRAEDRLEKFQEALDHAGAGDGEKADFARKVAEDFRKETNILQYQPEERLRYMETYVEGFNEMDHPSFKERANAARDIAQRHLQARLRRVRGRRGQQRREGPRRPAEDLRERGHHRVQVQRADRQRRVRLQGRSPPVGTRPAAAVLCRM